MNSWDVARIAAIAVAGFFPYAQAQDFPVKPVQIVVPFPAGGGGDLVIRSLGVRLSQQLNQSIVVENKVGAGGNIGSEIVAHSKADGYTLLEGGDHLTLSKALYKNLNYDTFKDLVPVTGVTIGPHVVLAHPSFEPNNLAELIAVAKTRPGTIAIATPGIGTAQDLFASLLQFAAEIDLLKIPYKGGAALLQDMLGGQVKVGVIGLAPAMAYIKSGKLKALAVTTPKRSTILPSVPAAAETVPGLTSVQWIALMAPAGTPEKIVARLASETKKALENRELRELLVSTGLEPFPLGPEELSKFMREDYATFESAVKKTGIKVE